jgi:two-component system nitrogen regulation sensor histidine kinase GlnL
MALAESEKQPSAGSPAPEAILVALPDPVLVIDGAGGVRYANPAAEQFFATGTNVLLASRLDELIPADSPLAALVRQVQDSGVGVYEHAAQLSTPRIGPHFLSVQVVPLGDTAGYVVVTLKEHSIATKMDRQLNHLGAARSVSGMAAVLAHEVKNPLSGIRGAAQLLEQNAAPDDRDLTALICDEADRICALVDRMELFSDQRPIERAAVNIHEVLDHVRKLGQAGFASRLRFKENYDPSLPPVDGHRDRLVQVFLNLVKNAAESASEAGGEITLSTAYRHGLRLAVPGSSSANRVHLPLEVSVQDNGPGVPEDVRAHLFEAFVTSKSTGTGLGLSLVAKIIGDHGGVIEWESEGRSTVFRVRLPVLTEAKGPLGETRAAP